MSVEYIDGGPQNARNVDVNQSQLPGWVNQGSEGLWNAATGVANRGYEGYSGPRIAAWNDDIHGSIDQTRNLGGTYQPSFDKAESMFADPGKADRLGPINDVSTGAWNGDAYKQYGNPWDDQVTATANRETQRQADIMRRNAGSTAATTGALGGKRDAIVRAEGDRNALQTISDQTLKSKQAGYQNAQSMFTSDQGRKLTADQGNQQMAFNTGRANQDASMFDVNSRLSGARGIADLGTERYRMGADQADRLMEVGDKRKDTEQQSLDLAHNDFLEQRDYDKNSVDWLSGLLPKLPTDKTNVGDQPTPTAQIGGTTGTPSTLGQIAGGVASVASMFKM